MKKTSIKEYKRKSYISFYIISASILLMFHPSVVHANMSNDSYQLETEIGVPLEKVIIEQEMKQKMPPSAKKQSREKNLIISSVADESFSFILSNESITFGILSATNPVIRTTTIQMTSPIGYQIFAQADHQLQNKSKNIIPDTTCDDGQCTGTKSSLWTNTLTYGFGYRCDDITSSACYGEFEQKDTYKQIPNQMNKQIPQPILYEMTATNKSENKLSYKINISGTQPKGYYNSTITYIAVPGY